METRMITVQTAATAQVGVWLSSLSVLLLPPDPAAAPRPTKKTHQYNKSNIIFITLVVNQW